MGGLTSGACFFGGAPHEFILVSYPPPPPTPPPTHHQIIASIPPTHPNTHHTFHNPPTHPAHPNHTPINKTTTPTRRKTQVAGKGKTWVSVGVIQGKAQMVTTPAHRVLLYPDAKGACVYVCMCVRKIVYIFM